jgi:hypothetical protein
MNIQSKLFGLGIGLLCSMVVSCSLVFNSDEYLAKEDNVDSDGGGGTGGSGNEEDGGESGSGGSDDAAAGDSAAAGDGASDAGDGGAQDAGTGGDQDSGTPPPLVECDEETDCNELLGTGWASICVDGVCVNCDRDDDGWISPDGRCDSMVEPADLRDCDDNDEDRYPHAPALCGDGKFNSCDVVLTPEAQTRFQVAEIGFIALTIISSVHDNIDIDEFRPADFTRASQISIAGQQVGEVGVDSHLVTALTFMDSEGSSNQPDQANTARLLTIDTWYDGWPDVQFMDQYNLSEFAQASDVRSVGIRRLSNNDSVITAMVGDDRSSGLAGSVLWYTRVASTGGEQYEPTHLERIPIPQTLPCEENLFDSTRSTLFPRLAIAGQAADGGARAVWTQNASSTDSPIVVSHLYSTSSSMTGSPFSCNTLDSIPADARYIDLSGSSGPFVVGGSSGQAFSWEGTASSPVSSLDIPTNSRPSFAFFEGADYLAAVAGPGGYSVSNLVCKPGSTEACALENMRNIALSIDTDLAAMDNLGTRAAALGLVETSGLPGSSDRADEVVIRLLGRDGEILPIGGVQYQTEPGSPGAEPQPLPTSSLFPVFRLEPSDDATSNFRVVDLAVSSWLEESSTASQYPLTILVAAIVTTEPKDISVSNGQPASGNLIVLTGIRGCREL